MGLAAVVVGMFGLSGSGVAAIPAPVELRVEDRPGIVWTDEVEPRFSWTPVVEDGGVPVVAEWELEAVVNEISFKGEAEQLWKPERWSVSEGPWKVWAGRKLAARDAVLWRVRGIDGEGNGGEWSKIARFHIGLLEEEQWGKAQWIGADLAKRGDAAPWLRKGFRLDKEVAFARLFVCGLGYHEAWLNGKKLGKAVLEPAQTDYESRSFYVVRDAGGMLRAGENALGIWLGDGFYNQGKVWGKNGMSYGEPRARARLEITFRDESEMVIQSDGSWQWSKSPIVSSNVYHGEVYDARLEAADWASPGGGDDWPEVKLMDPPGGKLMAQELPPCVRGKELPVVKSWEVEPGLTVHDFGRNFTGWAKLRVTAEEGTRISMTFGENCGPDGKRVDTLSTGTKHTKADQRDVYICRGGGEETWEPRFSWHGFQFVEVKVEDGKVEKLALTGVPVHTEMPVVGEFECSDPLVNRLLETAHWTQVSNVVGLPMDCPARERCGWTGDAHLCVPFTMYRYDCAAMWRKYLGDILTSAERDAPMFTFGKGMGDRKVRPKAKGIPTMVAPGKRFIGEASPDWGSAIVFIPWDLYSFTGDTRWLQRHYGSMKQWTEHVMELRGEDGIVRAGLGDWCKPWPRKGERPEVNRDYYGEVAPMLSTACLFRCTATMWRVALTLHQAEDAKRYETACREIREAFVGEFFDPAEGGFPDQTINAIAVQWGLVSGQVRSAAAKRLAGQVEEEDFHFMTGVFGAPSLWPTLADFGREEVAWKALQTESAPGFRYLFERGGTSFWEVWPTPEDEGERWERSMSHPFQGAFAQWFYSGLAGIRQDVIIGGFRQLYLRPVMLKQLESVDCRHRSAMGWIESSWKRDGKRVRWQIESPPGAKLLLHFPGKAVESGGCLDQVEAGSDWWNARPNLKNGRGWLVFEME